LTFEQIETPAVNIVVVDNDPEGPMRSLCTEMATEVRWPLRYVVEPRRGIPQARNRSVHEAGAVDFIAFIDDDEVPSPNWLEQLLLVQRAYQADVVAGAVFPRYPEGARSWIVNDSFFEGLHYETGTPIRYFATNNLLVRAAMLRDLLGPFDERLALTGGSDMMLARQLHRKRCTMIWAEEALTYESIPASRLQARWILQRAFRYGMTFSRTEVYIGAGILKQFIRGLKGITRVLQGLVTLPFLTVKGRLGVLKALKMSCVGIGELAGLLGYRYEEYQQVHGE